MSKYIINGGKKLSGEVEISGSKNAALPIMAAALLNKGKTVLKNVPNISDIHTMIRIFNHLNVKTEFEKNILKIDASKIENKEVPHYLVSKLRGSIVIIGALIGIFGEVKFCFPGGCVLGKRPIDTHLEIFENMGCEILESEELIHIKLKERKDTKFSLREMSVTGTENALIFASIGNFKTEISLCACEPHVQDTCRFLEKLGAKFEGIGSHQIKISGKEEINEEVEHEIISDYLQVGTYAIAAAITGSNIVIKNANESELDSFWSKMKEAGVKFEHKTSNNGISEVEIFPSENLKPVSINTGVFPLFPTDLQAPFSLIQVKANGESKVFETLFENRLAYLFELEKMGAKIEILNPHQAKIEGGTEIKGCEVSSCDIRAGAAMVLAGLLAEGESTILNIRYIDRGYDNFDEKLRKLGADIKRIKSV